MQVELTVYCPLSPRKGYKGQRTRLYEWEDYSDGIVLHFFFELFYTIYTFWIVLCYQFIILATDLQKYFLIQPKKSMNIEDSWERAWILSRHVRCHFMQSLVFIFTPIRYQNRSSKYLTQFYANEISSSKYLLGSPHVNVLDLVQFAHVNLVCVGMED